MAQRLDNITELIARDLGVHSCAITIMGHPVDGSNQTAADLEDWQFVLAEGPAVACSRTGAPVEHAGIGPITCNCPILAEHIIRAGICSVAAFPINLGSICLGTITLYSTSTSTLQCHQRDLAERWTQQLARSVYADPEAWAHRRQHVTRDFEIATGCAMNMLRVDADEAAAMIRAYAFARSIPLRALCHRVVHQGFSLQTELR